MTTDDHRRFADDGDMNSGFARLANQIAASDSRQTERLDRIEQQTIKTNGRVTSLEERVGKFDLWKAELKGIAQGAGGTGRLMFYVISSGAAAGSIIVAILTVTGHLK